jgi:hypothetical protein
MYLHCSGQRLSITMKKNKQVMASIKATYPKCKQMQKLLMVPIMISPAENHRGHSNILIFNTIRGECERFEPHGSQTQSPLMNSNRLNRSIERFVKELNLNLTYVPSDQVTESLRGFQSYEGSAPKLTSNILGEDITDPGGFCAVWSYFYADMRLKFPKIPAKELVKNIQDILGNDPSKLRSFIRGQAKFLSEEVASVAKYIPIVQHSKTHSWEKTKQLYDAYLVQKMEYYTRQLDQLFKSAEPPAKRTKPAHSPAKPAEPAKPTKQRIQPSRNGARNTYHCSNKGTRVCPNISPQFWLAPDNKLYCSYCLPKHYEQESKSISIGDWEKFLNKDNPINII